ncbi:hypothetical protein NC652_035106 [Populus alba x Populus x berolinensis]|uniref:Uncharacterized protein n=1 Tax=Populus alba x Populus x berolinensis TaxID=444605 RepID=A0AAD6LNU6_9ROSI|nr:hypothetical protein NC652_035106 [Populus alba x Populus x berolinensis]KAJ6970603.1 hypothetical protein NC653_035015 [Populus alba x Populus x berolinensis]
MGSPWEGPAAWGGEDTDWVKRVTDDWVEKEMGSKREAGNNMANIISHLEASSCSLFSKIIFSFISLSLDLVLKYEKRLLNVCIRQNNANACDDGHRGGYRGAMDDAEHMQVFVHI